MYASTRLVTRVDYGAGGPTSKRTQEEMQQGLEVTDKLGDISRAASKPALEALLLFKLIRTIRPTSCIEMGTCVGISTAYQAAALELNEQGGLVTLEGARPLAEVAGENLRQLGLKRVDVVIGRFQSTLPEVLKKVRPVDYVFIDGHHDECATIGYFEQILPSLSRTALLVFDDIAWSDEMKRAWGTISRDRRVGIAVDLEALGLCVIDPAIEGPRRFRIPFA
jgi:predicted O-methyltransferase YrrM